MCALPTHTMQVHRLLEETCNQLDRLNRVFLWSSDQNKRKIHLVKWATVTKSKKLGGLGIRKTRQANQSLLAKEGWRLMKGADRLWLSACRARYLKGLGIFQYHLKGGESNAFKGVLRSVRALEGAFGWRIGNGRSVSLWFDKWIGDTTLSSIVGSNINPVDLGLKVADVWHPDQGWCWNKVKTVIPPDIQEILRSHPMSSNIWGEDKIIFLGSDNGKFSCGAAYASLEKDRRMVISAIGGGTWNWIWELELSVKT